MFFSLIVTGVAHFYNYIYRVSAKKCFWRSSEAVTVEGARKRSEPMGHNGPKHRRTRQRTRSRTLTDETHTQYIARHLSFPAPPKCRRKQPTPLPTVWPAAHQLSLQPLSEASLAAPSPSKLRLLVASSSAGGLKCSYSPTEGRTSGVQRTPLERLLHIAASTTSPVGSRHTFPDACLSPVPVSSSPDGRVQTRGSEQRSVEDDGVAGVTIVLEIDVVRPERAGQRSHTAPLCINYKQAQHMSVHAWA
jgi:hypothetical protein